MLREFFAYANLCSYTCHIINQTKTQFLMKKVLLMLVAGAFISLSMVSCAKNKCSGGTYDGEGVTAITGLDESFPGAKASAKAACEAGGGDWK